MSSLNTTLATAVESLGAYQSALQTTNNNIANANTPGYSREIPIFQEAPPSNEVNYSLGNGVILEGVQSVRDQLVTLQIQNETQAQGSANAQLTSLQQIQPSFTTSTQDIGTQISALFASISNLSTAANDPALRESVLTAGQNLAEAFNTTSSTLTTEQNGLNTQVSQDVGQINQLTSQIAALNPQIAQLTGTGQDGGSLVDQQNQLVLELSALTNVSITQTGQGETVSTGNGTPLVVGPQSYALQTNLGSNGKLQVLDANGANITASLTSGDLGGSIVTRDQTIGGLLTSLDTLANQFGTAFNTVQTGGLDENGAAGVDFFNVPTTIAGSAGNISVAITNPAQFAASLDGSSGGNANLAKFTALETTKLSAGGLTPGDTYANLVFQVGSLTSNATAESTATGASLLQLTNQLSSTSGVSIDEEATNLITYQTAYEAAARVITTVQAMFSVTLAMGTAGAE